MPHYRIYFMNSSNGHIDRAEDLQARDDHEAIATAEPLVDGQPIEIWSGTRKVHRFETRSTSYSEEKQVWQASRQLEASYVQSEAAE